MRTMSNDSFANLLNQTTMAPLPGELNKGPKLAPGDPAVGVGLGEDLDELQAALEETESAINAGDETAARLQAQQEALLNEQAEMAAKKARLKVQVQQRLRQRNQALLAWWEEKYPEFNRLRLTELEAWVSAGYKTRNDRVPHPHELTGAAHDAVAQGGVDESTVDAPVEDVGDKGEHEAGSGSHGGNETNGNNSGANQGDHGQASKAKRLVPGQNAPETTEQQTAERQQVSGEDDPEFRNQSGKMKLKDKQRIAINKDENNPIDTEAEVQDAEEFESPLGNRDVDEEIDDFRDRNPVARRAEVMSRVETAKQTQAANENEANWEALMSAD